MDISKHYGKRGFASLVPGRTVGVMGFESQQAEGRPLGREVHVCNLLEEHKDQLLSGIQAALKRAVRHMV
jgi:hypothetical protein